MLNFFRKNKKIITHDGRFHSDDVFGCAVLSLIHQGNVHITRSRDESVWKSGDYVLDVGGEYDTGRHLFDHHQKGGAGIRDKGIPYASFGLIWKEYGTTLSGSKEIADMIDGGIVSSIDANDNGVDLILELTHEKVFPYQIQSVFGALTPIDTSDVYAVDKAFHYALDIAIHILQGEIAHAKEYVARQKYVLDIYEKTTDKRVLILDKSIPRHDLNIILADKSEVFFVVAPSAGSADFRIETIRITPTGFPPRRPFPQTWGGLRPEDLQNISGISDALFCHKNLFLCSAKTKEGAIAMTKKALE